MKKPHAISAYQLICLLLVGRLFIMMTYSPAGGDNTLITILGGLITNAALAVVMIFPLLLLKKFPDKNAVQLGYCASKPLGIMLSVIYTAFLAWAAVKTMCDFSQFITFAFPIFTAKRVIVVFMAATALYISTLGLEPIARSAAVVTGLFVVMLITVLLGTSGEIDVHNLNISIKDPLGGIIKSSLGSFARNSELIVACLLLPKLRSKQCGAVYGYITIKYIVVGSIAFLCSAILGNFAYSSPLPFFHLSSYSNTSVIARFDSLFLILWTFCAVTKLSLCIYLAGECIKCISPKIKPFYATLPVTAASLICSVFIIMYYDITKAENVYIWSAVIIILAAVIPALLLILPKEKRSRKESAT